MSHKTAAILDWQELDRIWFERHPERNYRFRTLYVSERFAAPGVTLPTAPPGWLVHVVVMQVCPGFRIRHRVVHTEQPAPWQTESDAYLAALAEWINPEMFAKAKSFASKAGSVQ
jgi:hypothetical protein